MPRPEPGHRRAHPLPEDRYWLARRVPARPRSGLISPPARSAREQLAGDAAPSNLSRPLRSASSMCSSFLCLITYPRLVDCCCGCSATVRRVSDAVSPAPTTSPNGSSQTSTRTPLSSRMCSYSGAVSHVSNCTDTAHSVAEADIASTNRIGRRGRPARPPAHTARPPGGSTGPAPTGRTSHGGPGRLGRGQVPSVPDVSATNPIPLSRVTFTIFVGRAGRHVHSVLRPSVIEARIAAS